MSLCLMCGLNRKDETLRAKGRQEDMAIERNDRGKAKAPDALSQSNSFLTMTRDRGKVRFHA